MSVAISLLAAALFAVVLRKPLQACPGVFYALAIAVDVLLLAGAVLDVPVALWRTVLALHSRCLFGFSLFAVVMLIGTFPDGGKVKAMLLPVRAELSLVASLLVLGHVANYLEVYLLRVLRHQLGNAAMAVSFAVALMAVLVMLPLAVTSLKSVKRRMPAAAWKRLQCFAYVFWALACVHVALILGGSALAGAVNAQASLIVYALLFAVYAVLRIRRALVDGAAKPGEPASGSAGAAEDAAASDDVAADGLAGDGAAGAAFADGSAA